MAYRSRTHRMLVKKRVNPVVFSHTYTLESATQGLDDLEQRKTWGKAVTRVREEPVTAKL